MTEKCFYGGINEKGHLSGSIKQISEENLLLIEFLSALSNEELIALISRIVDLLQFRMKYPSKSDSTQI